ncbi:MAG: hypothetical protein K2Q06_14455 [Parvularculaceae bacterium]|nr:hypothetical protein [Parvularculaceae bacterium]
MTGVAAALWSAPMSTKEGGAPPDHPKPAAHSAAEARMLREKRLAEALRANLRRRKAATPPRDQERKNKDRDNG